MSNLAEILRCRIERITTFDAARTAVWYSDVILENKSDDIIEFYVERRLALAWRFLVADHQDHPLHQMSFVDGNDEFPAYMRPISIPGRGDVRTSLPLLRTIPENLLTMGRFKVRAIISVGNEEIVSEPFEITVG